MRRRGFVSAGTALTLEEFAMSASHEEWTMHSSLQLALEERQGLIDLINKRKIQHRKVWSAASSRIVTGIAVSVVGLILVFGIVLLIWRTKKPHMRYQIFRDERLDPAGEWSIQRSTLKGRLPVGSCLY